MRSVWNTGRLYTEYGQIMVAETREGGIYFRDYSRMICGKVPLDEHLETERELREWVMAVYDASTYEGISLSEAPTIETEERLQFKRLV